MDKIKWIVPFITSRTPSFLKMANITGKCIQNTAIVFSYEPNFSREGIIFYHFAPQLSVMLTHDVDQFFPVVWCQQLCVLNHKIARDTVWKWRKSIILTS